MLLYIHYKFILFKSLKKSLIQYSCSSFGAGVKGVQTPPCKIQIPLNLHYKITKNTPKTPPPGKLKWPSDLSPLEKLSRSVHALYNCFFGSFSIIKIKKLTRHCASCKCEEDSAINSKWNKLSRFNILLINLIFVNHGKKHQF